MKIRLPTLIGALAIALTSLTAVGSQDENSLVCNRVLERLLGDQPLPRAVPVARYEIQPGVWLYQYADNMWGIAGPKDKAELQVMSVLFGNSPTPDRKDILYLFAHGTEKGPVFWLQGEDDKDIYLDPMIVWEKMEKTGQLPKEINAVVLVSCYSGTSRQHVMQPTHLAATAISARAGGVPAIAPTGALKFYGRTDPEGDLMWGLRLDNLDRDPESTGWVIVTARPFDKSAPRSPKLSSNELKQISSFYKNWEARSKQLDREETKPPPP